MAYGILWWFKVGQKLQPLGKGLAQLESDRSKFGLTINTNYVVQVVALLMQTINQLSGLLPPKGQFWATVVLTTLQGISAVLAQFSNPDGTSAKTAWVAGDAAKATALADEKEAEKAEKVEKGK